MRRGEVGTWPERDKRVKAAQGIRRFWKRAPDDAEMRGFVKALVEQMSNG